MQVTEVASEASGLSQLLLVMPTTAELLARKEAVICILHRLQYAWKFDRVAVVADGRVAEIGPPAELKSTPGSHFASLWAAAVGAGAQNH